MECHHEADHSLVGAVRQILVVFQMPHMNLLVSICKEPAALIRNQLTDHVEVC